MVVGKPKTKYSTTGSVTIFDFLNDLTNDHKFILNEENEHLYSKFTILRWLSLKKEYIPLVDCLNKYQSVLDNYEFHRFAMSLIGSKTRFVVKKGESPFFKPLEKEMEEEINIISNYFSVSRREAFQYFVNLTEKDQKKLIKNIKFYYGLIEK